MNREEIIENLSKYKEIVPSEYDGSYELVNEIINSYSLLEDFSVCNYKDLDAIYGMAVGTWNIKVDKKKERIQKTSLPEYEKERLCQIIDKVWDNACYDKYENHEESKGPSIGMFGAGLFTFDKKSSNIDCPSLIKMFTEINTRDDDIEMYNIAEPILSKPYKGIGAGAVSVILHCIKPFSFPIMNGNMGHGSIFSSLGINIENATEINTYISNCRNIKQYRDENFEFKNYRIFDIEARNLDNTEIIEEKKMNQIQFDSNTILYGPPGTGKTYNTVNYAVAIIEGKSLEEVKSEEYSAVKERYEQYKEAGQIAFTTFHQSYGYEEFIEGIKPIMDSESDDISYTVNAGIFKKFCDNALPTADVDEIEINKNATTWYIKIFPGAKPAEEILRTCIEEGTIRMNWSAEEYSADEEHDFLHWYKYDIEPGDYVVVSTGRGIIRAVGVFKEGNVFWDEKLGSHNAARKVNWLAYDMEVNLSEYNNGVSQPRFVIARLKNCTSNSIQKMLIDSGAYKEQINDKKYVFIIDEINRGNISKIFGELITLIEGSKRLGEKEAMSVVLPYSNASFGVPSNVYILGTMNTADRSIALMDTALRRRFSFEEMMPKSDVLVSIGADKVVDGDTELNVAKMLDTINRRIEYLYDREHTIGHAFFTDLKDNPTIENLAGIFEKSVIPLLQEYFYEDYSKIQLVLGDNAKVGDNKQYQFIRDEEMVINDVFAGVPDIEPETRYSIQTAAFTKIESYKLIGKGL